MWHIIDPNSAFKDIIYMWHIAEIASKAKKIFSQLDSLVNSKCGIGNHFKQGVISTDFNLWSERMGTVYEWKVHRAHQACTMNSASRNYGNISDYLDDLCPLRVSGDKADRNRKALVRTKEEDQDFGGSRCLQWRSFQNHENEAMIRQWHKE